VAFEQAAIKVEKEKEFQELKATLERVLAPESAPQFLKALSRNGIRIRDFDVVLRSGVLDSSGARGQAQRGYESLTVSDQAQIREFYLSKLERVDVALRHKFKKLFQYY
jgi:hypothetical protein